MKKLIFTIYLSCSLLLAYSQPWFDVGLKGGIGTSFMYNQKIFDDQEVIHKFKPGYNFGAKLGFNFIQEHQITFDVLKSSLVQGFEYSTPENPKLNREFSFDAIDMLLMYRSNRGGTYFEVGPQWTTISNASYSDEGEDMIQPLTASEILNKSNFGMAVGFGGYIFGTDNFGVSTGFRLSYMFNDLATDEGRNINFPILKTSENSKATHNLSAMFVVEVNYDFGYLVSSSCGQRKKLFVF